MEIELRAKIHKRPRVLIKMDLWTLVLHSLFFEPFRTRAFDPEQVSVLKGWLSENHLEDLHLFVDGKEIEQPGTWTMED